MKARINTYADLELERLRLEGILAIQKAQVRQDVADLREELKPVRSALTFAGKFISKDNKNPLLNVGVDMVGDLLFKNLLFARSGFITKLIAPFILKNLSANFLSKNGDGLLESLSDKVRQLLSSFRKKEAA